ncbi:MAG: Riboflavin transporter [Pseudomonadota bacterium]|jgi:drug/metabolite transporter (DMT)-like permease
MSDWLSDTAQNRRKGIALLSLATLMFATLDACAKWLVITIPVIQVVFVRFLLHTVITAALFAPSLGWQLVKVNRPGLQLLRGVMLVTMTAMNFWALQYLQLAETGAIQFSVPILIALMSTLWLKESLDLQRWLAIALGFVGVLIIIRPGSNGFHPAILLSVLNAVFYALFNLLTRRLGRDEHPAATQWISALVSTVSLAPIALWDWHTPTGWLTWLAFLVTGLCGGLGHYFSAAAHRYASAAVISPFMYQQILYMTAWGWILFAQVPDLPVVWGACVVVLSGAYLLWREFKKQQLPTFKSENPS